MNCQSKPIETSTAPHPIFVLPPLEPARKSGLTLLVLADGNRRSSPRGYASGARAVVSVAEHLARREDVSTLVTCILSPDNIEKRGDAFFFDLYRAFIGLGVEMARSGVLLRAGVRMDLAGDLRPLRDRDGHAAALADAMEAVTAMTASVVTPDLRLVLGVGYGPRTALDLGADIVLRTGMEEPGVLRLSGLETSDRMALCGTTTLWPDIDPREIDEVIDRAKDHAMSAIGDGYGTQAIVDIVRAIGSAFPGERLSITLPATAPAEALAAIEGISKGPHEVRIDGGARSKTPQDRGVFRSVIAPGQTATSLTLPSFLTVSQANIIACDTSPAGIVNGIHRALGFASAHPPLLGRDRVITKAPSVVRAKADSARERDEIADRFTEKILAWAASAGLMLEGPEFRTAATNYVLTAFFMCFRAGGDWESHADLAAKYMLLVAVGDEGIFDWLAEGESPEDRWRRIEASSRFLRGALDHRAEIPRVARADVLSALADQWRALFDSYRGTCHPLAAACFRRGLASHYVGELSEHRAGLEGRESRGPTAVADRFAGAPPEVTARALHLASKADDPSAQRELCALAYLADAGAAIAAGLLFRTLSLATPEASVTAESVAWVDTTATIVDYHFRLSNDLSTFLSTPSGDRDAKENACTILVPRGLSGPPRARAIIEALTAAERLVGFLAEEEERHIDGVASRWPSMGVAMRRAVFVGRRVYETGHYTTLIRAEMSAIFDEAERDPRMTQRLP